MIRTTAKESALGTNCYDQHYCVSEMEELTREKATETDEEQLKALMPNARIDPLILLLQSGGDISLPLAIVERAGIRAGGVVRHLVPVGLGL